MPTPIENWRDMVMSAANNPPDATSETPVELTVDEASFRALVLAPPSSEPYQTSREWAQYDANCANYLKAVACLEEFQRTMAQ